MDRIFAIIGAYKIAIVLLLHVVAGELSIGIMLSGFFMVITALVIRLLGVEYDFMIMVTTLVLLIDGIGLVLSIASKVVTLSSIISSTVALLWDVALLQLIRELAR